MADILKSIKAFLYDRTVSPLFGAFAIAWIAWNYRVVIAMLDGDAPLAEKTAFLDAYFADDHLFQLLGFTFHVWGGGQLVHGLLMPALFTFFYLYVYPKFAKPVYQHSLRKQIELRAIRQEEENARLLTAEESRNLQTEIEQLRLRADEEAAGYQSRIASLTKTINELENALGKNKLKEAGKETTQVNTPLTGNSPLADEPSNALVLQFKRAIGKLYPIDSKEYKRLEPLLDEFAKNAAKYSSSHNFSVERALVLSVLAQAPGGVYSGVIKEILGNELSSLEVDNEINKLRADNLAMVLHDGKNGLTPGGISLAVDLGLARLLKQIT